jgi:alkylhydroperoxidase family enzyme
MARISALQDSDADATPESRAAIDEIRLAHGRVTNMKRTLARSPVALRALMQWYDLHAEVVAFLGTRATTLFAHAVSSKVDCLVCSTFFRRWLIEAGEDPDALRLDEREQAIVAYGRQLAQDANGVTNAQFAALRTFLSEAQLVTLTVFGGLMLATNVFNNALQVDLDDYLLPFRKGGPA